MRTLALTAIIAALLAWGSAAAAPQGAGPAYVASDPEPGEERQSPPDEVTITFSEPLDDSSQAQVLDACDRRIDDRASEVFANELSVGIATTPAGEYRVFYEATGVGGATGTTRGAFGFEVTTGPSCGGNGGHGGHDPNGGGQQGDGDHGNHSGEGGDGDHGEHGAGPGAAPGDHDGHSDTMGGAHSDHPGGETNGGRGDHGDHVEAAQELQAERRAEDEADLTAAPGPPEAGGAALVLGLGLAAAVGLLGGWFLRVSRPS